MKFFVSVFVVVLAISSSELAQAINLPADAKSLTPLPGTVVRVEFLTGGGGPGPSPFPGTRITIQFELIGCVDDLSPVYYVYDEKTATIYVSAYNIGRAGSEVVKCVDSKKQNVSIELYGILPTPTVSFLNSRQAIPN